MAVARELRFDELDDLLGLYVHLNTETGPAPLRSRVESVWKQLFSDPNCVYLGADAEGRLAASCTVTIIPNLTRRARPYGVIENVITHPDFRLRGLGAAVMNGALECCWKRDCYKVMLLSGAGRGDAHAFYERLGFDKNAKQAFIIRR